MRSITLNMFKFGELSISAQMRAIQEYAADEGYHRSEEALASIKALAKHFDGKVTEWDVDFFNCSHSRMTFDMPDMSKAEIRRRLNLLGTYNRKTLKGNGACQLTGFCCDEDCIDGFRVAFIREKVTDLERLMRAAFKTWLKACQDDCEDFYSTETFADHCDANNFEFYEDGSFYSAGGA